MSAAIDLPQLLVERTAAPLNSACIACGDKNTHGLHLRFSRRGHMAAADWTPCQTQEGFRGVIHGGVIATVLDEAMSKAVVYRGWEALTVELTIRLRAKVKPGENLTVLGMILTKRKREIQTEACIIDAAGRERAHAWAKFLVVR